MPHIEIKFNDLVFEPKVQLYCLNPNFKCPNYNNNWACPPEAPYLEDRLSKFEKFYLIIFKLDIKSHSQSIRKKHPNFSLQRILNRIYSKRLTEKGLEMKIYRFLDNYDEYYEEKIVLWGGHCQLCYDKLKKGCSKPNGEPCRFPDKKRYSMEAIGINVDKTVKNVNIELEWPPNDFLYRFGLICFK